MNVEIAERLAARRKMAGLSQEALAEKLGVSRQAVSKWERSESSPDTDNLIALAKLYGVSLDELLYVDESIEDDVAFEAADRAAGQRGGGAAGFGSINGGAGPAASGEEVPSPDGTASSEDDDASSEQGDKDKVHIGLDGIHVDDGKDHVHVSWAEGVHVIDRHGEEVHVGWDGVRVNSSNPDLADHIFSRGMHPAKFDSAFAKRWLKFPFWAIVLVLYLFLGMISGGTLWGPGLFLLFLIPAYYIVGAAIASRRIAPMLCALYPLGAIAWFFWMIFMEPNWHAPAWVIFLTIPLVEVIIVKTSEWWYRRKTEADA